MDSLNRRLTLLAIMWIYMEIQLVLCYGYQHHSTPYYMPLPHPNRNNHKGYITPDHSRNNKDARLTDRESRQDSFYSLPMLEWMRQMIFKTKSMYIKHKLEFELSGCFIGFIRKAMFLIYKSLYTFNKKLIFAENMKEIAELGKAGTSASNGNLPNNEFGSETADTKNIGVKRSTNGTWIGKDFENIAKQSTNHERKLEIILSGSSTRNNTITISRNGTDMKELYSKVYDLNEQLERSLNKMNRINESIGLSTLKNTETLEMKKTTNVINKSQSLLAKENSNLILKKTTHIDNRVIFEDAFFRTLQEIGNDTSKITKSSQTGKEIRDAFNKMKHYLDSKKIKLKANKKTKFSDHNSYSQNEAPVARVKDKSMKSTVPSNKYNLTQQQIKIISNRVKRFLIYLNEKKMNQNEKQDLSRQLSTDSLLYSINSVILYFLGFSPEEDDLAHFMSMVGTDMRDNLLRVGSGFNSIRHSELVSCMTHYGRTKFWNWIDTCCS